QRFALLRRLEGRAAPLRAEVSLIDQLDSVPLGERERALAAQEHVRRVLEHETGEDDRILHRAEPGHGAGAERRAVHDRRIELVLAALVEDRAFTGVEERRILEPLDGILDGIERRGAAAEPRRSRSEHVGKRGTDLRVALLCAQFLTAGACTAVYRERPGPGARRIRARPMRSRA